jgi:hypothetical protein
MNRNLLHLTDSQLADCLAAARRLRPPRETLFLSRRFSIRTSARCGLVLIGTDLDVTKRPQVSSCDRTAALLACLQDVHELVLSRRHPLGISARYAKKLLMSGGHHT